MALLAGGMAQLQAVMIQQLTNDKDRSGDKSPETVKPGVSSLPSLPQVSPTTASVDIMDWLELLAAPMSDLSDGSGEWWLRVKSEASKAYQAWTSASPIEKLRIQPPQVSELETGRWSRVNSRASSMILLALHGDVRQEMASRRSTGSAAALLFRLLTIYQPGGQQEKVQILSNLQQPAQERDPQQAVSALRAWARWLRRCRDLGVAAPDPSLLARGLTSMTRLVLERDQEVSFRTSLVRSDLLVDTKPTYDTVEQYYHHLLAECEAMAVTGTTSGTTTSTTSTGTSGKPEHKMRPMKPDPKSPPPPPPAPTRTTSQNELQPQRTTQTSVRKPLVVTMASPLRDVRGEQSALFFTRGMAMRRRERDDAIYVEANTLPRIARLRSRQPRPGLPLQHPLRHQRHRPQGLRLLPRRLPLLRTRASGLMKLRKSRVFLPGPRHLRARQRQI